MPKKIIYFDNAATTYPKPKSVIKSIAEAFHISGGNPGRGGHFMSRAAGNVLYRLREAAADLFSNPSPENVIITSGATHALNIAVISGSGLMGKASRKPFRILTSDIEHNSVIRPLEYLKGYGAEIKKFEVNYDSKITLGELERSIIAFAPHMLVVNMRSNISGLGIDVGAVGELCRKYGLLFVLDGSQGAGHYPIEMEKMGIDALCLPGHKGLYGPSGIGLLLISDKMRERLEAAQPLLFGGTGINSAEPFMPDTCPERYESGTMSAPLSAGLISGIEFVKKLGVDNISRYENKLGRIAHGILRSFSEVEILNPEASDLGVISFNVKGVFSEGLSEYLDHHGICLRAGLHCAPDAHKKAGSFDDGGALRMSFSVFNKEWELYAFKNVMAEFLKHLTVS